MLLIAGDFETSGAVLEGVEPRRVVMAFLEGAKFVFDHSSVLGPSAQRLDEALESMVWACDEGSGVHGALTLLLISLPDFKCAGYL